jgi:hypothetical protein
MAMVMVCPPRIRRAPPPPALIPALRRRRRLQTPEKESIDENESIDSFSGTWSRRRRRSAGIRAGWRPDHGHGQHGCYAGAGAGWFFVLFIGKKRHWGSYKMATSILARWQLAN